MMSLPLSLIDALLKGSLLLGLAAVAARLLRGHSAAARHAVWTIALVGQLVLPLLSLGLPTWELPVLPQRASRIEHSSALPPSTSVTRGEQPRSLNDAGSSIAGRWAPWDVARSLPSTGTIVVGIWLVGFAVMLARLAMGLAAVRRLAARAEKVRDSRWIGLVLRIALALRVRRRIALLRGDRFDVPVTWGIVRPKVLLPSDADEWSPTRRQLVLIHELAHIKRFDAVTQMLARLAQAIFWMNPLVWVAARQMRHEQERACDDYVIRGGAVASTYARELLEMVRTQGSSVEPAATALAFARRSEFEGRMVAILDPGLNRRPLGRTATALAAMLALLLIVPLAAFRPVPRSGPALPTSIVASKAMSAVGSSSSMHIDSVPIKEIVITLARPSAVRRAAMASSRIAERASERTSKRASKRIAKHMAERGAERITPTTLGGDTPDIWLDSVAAAVAHVTRRVDSLSAVVTREASASPRLCDAVPMVHVQFDKARMTNQVVISQRIERMCSISVQLAANEAHALIPLQRALSYAALGDPSIVIKDPRTWQEMQHAIKVAYLFVNGVNAANSMKRDTL